MTQISSKIVSAHSFERSNTPSQGGQKHLQFYLPACDGGNKGLLHQLREASLKR